MTEAEIALVRRWLEAGGPAPRNAADKPPTEEKPSAPVKKDETLIGGLHPLVLHFPIALVLVAALAELLVWRFGLGHENTVRLTLLLGVLGGMAAAVTGWGLAESEGYRDATVFWHRWLAVASVGTSLLAFVLIETSRKKEGVQLLAGRLLLFAAAALTAAAGHKGGALVHDYLLF